MLSRPIELHAALPLASAAARESLLRVMRGISSTSSTDRLALAVYLGDLHVAVQGEIRVPVEVSVDDRPVRWEYAIAIRAASDEGFFPTFAGTLSITPVGTQSELWLQGSYQAPFGMIGALLDRTVLRHAAHRSLQSFLQRVADDTVAGERATEARHAQDVRGFHD